MVSTRTNAQVVVRDHTNTNRFVKVEISTLGDGKSTQRQCSTGELEFDFDGKRFVTIPKKDRKPFTADAVSTTESVGLKDRR